MNNDWESNQYSVEYSAHQIEFISKFLYAVELNNHLLVAPVGSGKSIVASEIIQQVLINKECGRALIIAPNFMIADQYRFLLSNQGMSNINLLTRRSLRELRAKSTYDEWLEKDSTVVVTTWDTGKKGSVLEFLMNTHWNLAIFDAENVKPGTQRMQFLESILMGKIADKSLTMMNSYIYQQIGRKLSDTVDISVTRWTLSDVFMAIPDFANDLQVRIFDYVRSQEEIEFIKQYEKLRKMIRLHKSGLKLRPRFISSSIYAAENELRKFRNKLVHADILTLFEGFESESEDSDTEILSYLEEKSIREEQFDKLLIQVNKTLGILNTLKIDAKYEALISLFSEEKGINQTYIYTSYRNTIVYLYDSIIETGLDVYYVTIDMPTERIRQTFDRFSKEGGILIGSSGVITGVS